MQCATRTGNQRICKMWWLRCHQWKTSANKIHRSQTQGEEHMTLQEELEQGIYPTDPFTRLTDEQWKLLNRNMKKQEIEDYEEALL
jgi:RNA polymerase-binding transcription factor DksA